MTLWNEVSGEAGAMYLLLPFDFGTTGMYVLPSFFFKSGFFKKEPETEKLHDQHQTAHN